LTEVLTKRFYLLREHLQPLHTCLCRKKR
jgi:hypothetical protein